MRSRREELQDLAGLGVPVQLRFPEDVGAVPRHLEATAARRNQLDVGVRMLLADLGRQTDGPWLVVSKRAVFDRDLHRSSALSPGLSALGIS
jgi:hypothetical protein